MPRLARRMSAGSWRSTTASHGHVSLSRAASLLCLRAVLPLRSPAPPLVPGHHCGGQSRMYVSFAAKASFSNAMHNCRFNADAKAGHAFAIFMASVGTLRPTGLRRRLTLATRASPSVKQNHPG